MDKKTRAIVIIGCIVTFVIVPAVTLFVLTKDNKQPVTETPKTNDSSKNQLPDRSDDDLTKAITDSKTDLADGGKPTFAISHVARPASGWYVVTIHLLDDPQGSNPAKVLLHDDGDKGGLSVLLGPGTSFPSDVTESIGVPSIVAQELNK